MRLVFVLLLICGFVAACPSISAASSSGARRQLAAAIEASASAPSVVVTETCCAERGDSGSRYVYQAPDVEAYIPGPMSDSPRWVWDHGRILQETVPGSGIYQYVSNPFDAPMSRALLASIRAAKSISRARGAHVPGEDRFRTVADRQSKFLQGPGPETGVIVVRNGLVVRIELAHPTGKAVFELSQYGTAPPVVVPK